jgi:hypothetical protein
MFIQLRCQTRPAELYSLAHECGSRRCTSPYHRSGQSRNRTEHRCTEFHISMAFWKQRTKRAMQRAEPREPRWLDLFEECQALDFRYPGACTRLINSLRVCSVITSPSARPDAAISGNERQPDLQFPPARNSSQKGARNASAMTRSENDAALPICSSRRQPFWFDLSIEIIGSPLHRFEERHGFESRG